MHKLIAFSFSLVTLSFIYSSPVLADAPGDILPPFDIGTSWNICQGYNNAGGSHSASSGVSLDLTSASCNSAAAGMNVRAPLAGTVSWVAAGSGSICISENSGRSIMLTHINPTVIQGARITAGQLVGTIAASGERQNNGVAHLHMQAWSRPLCNDPSAIVPFASSARMRICGAPDMTISGPNVQYAGTWANTRFTAQNCINIIKKADGQIYRFWSDKNKHHFYTNSYDEARATAYNWPDVWTYEPQANFGVINYANGCQNSVPVYRFWSDRYQGHFYTADEAEKNRVIAAWPDVWTYEGPKFCASPTPTATETKALYRFWSDRYRGHFYTADAAEKDRVIATWPDAWTYERVAFYVQ